jgi:hypothetical protein
LAIASPAYLVNAAAASSCVLAIVTVADVPPGPANFPPTSPDPRVIDQPWGTPTVTRGAFGSSTLTANPTGGLTGCEQVMVFGGTGIRVVGTTPCGDWSAWRVGAGFTDGGLDPTVVRAA